MAVVAISDKLIDRDKRARRSGQILRFMHDLQDGDSASPLCRVRQEKDLRPSDQRGAICRYSWLVAETWGAAVRTA